MFTGIVEETGKVAAFTQGGDSWKLQIAAEVALKDIALGDSIVVNGCCLTIFRRSRRERRSTWSGRCASEGKSADILSPDTWTGRG
jgi:riboflavin synthase alpha subunit